MVITIRSRLRRHVSMYLLDTVYQPYNNKTRDSGSMVGDIIFCTDSTYRNQHAILAKGIFNEK